MDLEIYSLRIFCQVMIDKSFSAAAKTLGMTQPTISQQIAKLERTLGAKLFERVGHEIIPTATAKELYQFSAYLLDLVTDFTEKMQRDRSSPKGKVRYAMPESCQWTPHFRKIMNQITSFPDIQFEVEILPNEKVVQGLLEGALDFGFVVGERLAPELRFEKFSDEKYSAVAASKELLEPLTSGKIEDLRIISYPGWEHAFSAWSQAHGLWKKLKMKLKGPTVRIGTLAGAIHAVQEGAGVAIIPTHCVSSQLSSKALREWTSKKEIAASSPIYLTRRLGEKNPRRVEVVVDLLRQAKAAFG